MNVEKCKLELRKSNRIVYFSSYESSMFVTRHQCTTKRPPTRALLAIHLNCRHMHV